jgi:exodeoxyribonuclease VII large subunit
MKFQVSQLSGLQHRLQALNPLAILQRGYAVVSQADGSLIRSVAQVEAGDQLNVRVSDGEFSTQVTET